MRIAPSLHRIGASDTVNCYVVEELGQLTIIDAGMAGHWRDLPVELAAMSRTIEDVRAVLLTHGHPDHIGFAERIRATQGIGVSIHELDAALARGEVPNPGGATGPVRIGPLLSFAWFGLRKGGLRTTPIGEVATFGDGATLDAPGSPRVIHVPGHTPGSAALHLAALDALFVGDAIATRAVTNGATGPMLGPFSADRALALASLDRLEGVEARWLLPGHGAPWTGGVLKAIAIVRRSEASRSGGGSG